MSISTQLQAQETKQLGESNKDRAGTGHFPEQARDFQADRIQAGWEFRRDDQQAWEPVKVPATFENQQGVGFDG
ncbi:MAG: hypothetical protein ACK5GJ_03620, partial [Planctomycetota bacterium]